MSEMASLSIACLSNRIQRLIHIQLQRYADLLYLLLILFPSKREVELISIKWVDSSIHLFSTYYFLVITIYVLMLSRETFHMLTR